jgi:hypothetical protein
VVVHARGRPIIALDVAYGEGVQLIATTEPLRAFAGKDTEL